jgi:CRISPR-associated endonuclease/helicase Cas3
VSGLAGLWAKSPRDGESAGELLTAHLAATLGAAVKVHDRVGELGAAPPGFWGWARLAALLHDAGKAAAGFQVMVGNGPGPAQRWGERHEVLSLGFAAKLLAGVPAADRRWVAAGVLTHHRPLTGGGRGLSGVYAEGGAAAFAARFGPVDLVAAGELLDWLAVTAAGCGLLPEVPAGLSADGLAEAAYGLFGEVRECWQAPAGGAEGRVAVLLQGAVTLADHLSSAHAGGGLHVRQPVDAGFAAALAGRLRLHDHQERAGAVDGDLLLRAPTGTGKTEAALLWAARQVEAVRAARGGQPRVFYTLPYLASINAMADRLGDGLGDRDLVGVAHSRAALYHLSRSLCDDDVSTAGAAGLAGKAVSRAAATRLFRELVRVGTPYQLLRGALAGPAHSGILVDCANSVFILDELHAYDARRLGFILAMVALWKQLGGRVAVLSATLPGALADLLGDALGAGPVVVEAMDRSWPVRHRVAVRAGHLTGDAAAGEIEARLRAGQAVLVVANNVADARTLFGRLGPVARRYGGEGAAELLHSRFRAMDRDGIERRIRARYATGAARVPGLVVATQVVEVSLDVDFDALHTSGAPLEALIQRFGRVNRLGARPPADVVVHAPDYRARRGGGAELWADGVYECGPAELAMGILGRCDGAGLSEHQLGEWLDEVYGSAWGQQWRGSAGYYRSLFERGFLRFDLPFDDRSDLRDDFDAMFEGTEAILAADEDDYAAQLNCADGAAGRLLGSQYLIPLPHYGPFLGRYDKRLKVTVVDADYDAASGLGQIRAAGRDRRGGYEPGEVL